jgi:enterochelin esterase-like enzyme
MKFRLLWGAGLIVISCQSVRAEAAEPLSIVTLESRLATANSPEALEALAKEIVQWFGKDRTGKENVKTGANPKVEELATAWAIGAEGAKSASVVTSAGKTIPLIRMGDTALFAGVARFDDGAAFTWHYAVDGAATGKKGQLETYRDPPELRETAGVPKGTLTKQKPWESKIFANTKRDWWVYVPAQYKQDQPACVMVFQDGGGYTSFVPKVFDNLIAKGEMPVTVAVLINPGTGSPEKGVPRNQRSVEYDTLSDRYSRFLLDEILPEVEKTVKLRHDPQSRAIAGSSSGGICAFTVAWQRPDEFRKVLSWVGSFTNIASGKTGQEGGHNYEALIRKTPKKPIRVFLQDGSQDLDNANGNWPLANQQMAKSLAFAGYDYRFVYGQGFHSGRHGRAILPDSLRWLWRGYLASDATK